MQLWQPKKKYNFSIFVTFDELIDHAVRNFVELVQKTLTLKKRCCIALSGGSTPKNFFEKLIANHQAKNIDWSKICLFWSDERAVLPTDDESNYKLAMNYFSAAPFSKAKIFRMEAERTDRIQAASEYELAIYDCCSNGVFDIVYLGMGDDGHTASLFPHTTALHEQKKLVVPNYIESKKTWRMTLTARCINQARVIIALISGTSKSQMLQEAICGSNRTNEIPIQLIGTDETPVNFFVDKAAAALLPINK